MSEQTWADVPATVDLGALSGPARSAAAREKLRVDGFLILGILGQGGMGVVYKAQQQLPKRLVALKMIQTGAGATDDQLKRFRDEAEAGAKAAHQNVVQVFHVGDADGCPYIAMEYIDGPTLLEHWDGKPQPPMQVAEVVRTLALAIENAHEKEVVHRDLKPGNVLLAGMHGTGGRKRTDDTWTMDAGVVPKISDFGLAKLANEETGKTYSGQIIGTPSYMAPEQAAGKKDIGPAADIWALGASLYCGLTGRPPFRGETDVDTLAMVRFQEPVSPRQLAPKVPLDLETICLKCLQKEVHKRYASAQAVAEDLGRFIRHEPILARPVGRAERVWRWCKRNPAEALLAGAAVTCLIIGAIVASSFALLWMEKAQEAQNNFQLSERQRYAAEVALVERALEDGNVEAALGGLQRQIPVQGSKRDLRGFEWYCLQRRSQMELSTLTGHKGAVRDLAVSPNGRLLASAGVDGTVRIWDMALGKERLTLRGHETEVSCVAFSPDGLLLASGGGTYRAQGDPTPGQIKFWNVESGKQVFCLPDQPTPVSSVVFSFDGGRLASVTSGQLRGLPCIVKVWDLATRHELFSRSFRSPTFRNPRFSLDAKSLALACTDGSIRIWDAATGAETRCLKSSSDSLWGLAASPNGQLLAAHGFGSDFVIIDYATGRQFLHIDRHRERIRRVTFSPNSGLLVSTSEDRTAKVWDVKSGKEISTIRGHTSPVLAAVFSPDGRLLVTGETCGAIKVWDPGALAGTIELGGHKDLVWRVAFSDDGRYLASASNDHAVTVWRTRDWARVSYLVGHKAPVQALAFTSDSSRLISASSAGVVMGWDVESGQELVTFAGIGERIGSVTLDADRSLVIAASDNGTIRVSNVESGTSYELGEAGEHIHALVCDGGSLLASGDDGGTLTIWDLHKRSKLRTIAAHGRAIRSLAFSKDSTRLASGSDDNSAKIWDVASGQLVDSLIGHIGTVHSVAFSPDDRRLITSGLDQVLKVWDSVTGQEMLSLNRRPCYLYGVAFSPDGLQLACGSDKSVVIWDGRPLTSDIIIERQARSVVTHLCTQQLPTAKIVQQILEDLTISDVVRQRALTLASQLSVEFLSAH